RKTLSRWLLSSAFRRQWIQPAGKTKGQFMCLPIQIRHSVFVAAALACVAISGNAHAVTPPPDGGYPNYNTAEGDDALFSLTSGGANTAIGTQALYSLTTGNNNTAVGAVALYSNTTGSDNTAIGELTLPGNRTGVQNTAVGSRALSEN